MTLKVEVISKQTIKPSSPTPPHLKNVKLSLLDQYSIPTPLTFILFYTANDDHKHKPADHLKKSLSQTLSYFYPLAGRLNDDHQTIDCNDEGANFFETRVNNVLLNQVVENPLREELKQLISTDNFNGLGPQVLLSVQANMFDCGGMALGVTIAHKVADASSLAFFLTVWSEVSRGDKVTLHPTFNMSTIFPPKAVPSASRDQGEKLVVKRFVFDASNVAALKAKCSNKSYVEHPTRVEAVSALIWKCTMNVLRTRPESPPKLASVVNLTVNLRPRMAPPLLNNSFGNSAMVVTAISSTTETKDSELQCLVARLRGAISKVDAEFVRGFDIEAWIAKTIPYYIDDDGEFERYTFSIMCRFPFYQVDFGWGKPTWACPLQTTDENLIQMVDTKCGDGVEAWVILSEEDMIRFESEPDLIAFTAANQIAKNSHLLGENN